MMNRKLFALAFAGALLVFIAAHFLDFPGSVPDFVKKSGGGVLLDMRPEFSEDAMYERLNAYGETGRANYAFRNVTVDVLLPLGLLPFLLMLMLRALNKTSLGNVMRAILLSLPIAYVLLDLAENGSVLAILASFPERLHLTSAFLPYLTVIKRAASLLSLLLPLLILASAFARDQFRRFHSPQ